MAEAPEQVLGKPRTLALMQLPHLQCIPVHPRRGLAIADRCRRGAACRSACRRRCPAGTASRQQLLWQQQQQRASSKTKQQCSHVNIAALRSDGLPAMLPLFCRAARGAPVCAHQSASNCQP